MIKAIIFDYGGVIELKSGDQVQEIADILGITKEKWQNTYYTLNHLNNVGNNTWMDTAVMVAKKMNASKAQISLMQNIIEKSNYTRTINAELLEIIKDFKERDYKIGLLSNYQITLREKLEKQNIIHLFDEVIISAEVGYQKPQPEIFNLISARLGINTNEFVFIDDTKRSLENADNIGYTPILYFNNTKLKEDIENILNIKNS